MFVYLYLDYLSVLVYWFYDVCVWGRKGMKEEGNYITNLPWLLMQFPSLLFSQSHMFDS